MILTVMMLYSLVNR